METDGLFSKLAGPKSQIEKSRQRFSNRDLSRLIVPILVELLLAMLLGIAGTMMVSYAGNQLNNVFIFVFATAILVFPSKIHQNFWNVF